MALTIELGASIATTRDSWSLSDLTVYGGANPLRADVGVFVTSYKMSADASLSAVVVTPNTIDPATVSNWDIEYTADGAYKTYFSIIPEFNIASTYAIYAAVYDYVTNAVYRSKQNANTEDDLLNTTWWELITEPAALANNKEQANQSLNITSVVYLRVFSANGQYYFANYLSDQCACTDCDELVTLQQYNTWIMFLDAIAIDDSRSEVIAGELLCRKVQSKFIDCLS